MRRFSKSAACAALLATLVTNLTGVIVTVQPAYAQLSFPPPSINPVRPRVIRPGINIQVTVPTNQPTRTATPPAPTPVPDPEPALEPVFRTGIPLPQPKPVLSLGRPALLAAERLPDTIAVLVQNGSEQLYADFDLALVSKTHIALLDADLVLLRVAPGQDVDTTVVGLLNDARVIGAQPGYLFELQQSGSAQMLDLQYAPQKMSLERAHQFNRGENTTIAVIDTGIDMSHVAFGGVVFPSFDAVGTPSATPEPHGTAIAGLISANHDLLGVAPAAKIISARAFAQSNDGRFLSDSYTIAQAIDWAVAEGAQVLNMSFAGPRDPLVLKVIDVLADRGVLVVAAAGNKGPGADPAYPGAHPHAIAVTATDAADALYANANRGAYITIAAPGVDVLAPAPGNAYELLSGTSIATAHITGIVALLLSEYPDLKRADIIALLHETAHDAGDPGFDPDFGLGLVDAYEVTALLKSALAGKNG